MTAPLCSRPTCGPAVTGLHTAIFSTMRIDSLCRSAHFSCAWMTSCFLDAGVGDVRDDMFEGGQLLQSLAAAGVTERRHAK